MCVEDGRFLLFCWSQFAQEIHIGLEPFFLLLSQLAGSFQLSAWRRIPRRKPISVTLNGPIPIGFISFVKEDGHGEIFRCSNRKKRQCLLFSMVVTVFAIPPQ